MANNDGKIISAYLERDGKFLTRPLSETGVYPSTRQGFFVSKLNLEPCEEQRHALHDMEAISEFVKNMKMDIRRPEVPYMQLWSKCEDSHSDATYYLYLSCTSFFAKLAGVITDPYIRIVGYVKLEDNRMKKSDIYAKKFDIRFSCLQENVSEMVGPSLTEVNIESLIQAAASAKKNVNTLQLKFIYSIIVEWKRSNLLSIQLGSDKILQNLYDKELSKDCAIVVGNEMVIKCHGFILAAHSPVFDRMLSPSNGMKESTTRKIEIADMTEQGMKYFIRYLYSVEISPNELSCEVVTELFQAGHKYQIHQLEKAMNELLLEEDDDWYVPSATLELYFFLRNLDGREKLVNHLIAVMSRMSDKLRVSQKFKELSKEETDDLMWKLFDMKTF